MKYGYAASGLNVTAYLEESRDYFLETVTPLPEAEAARRLSAESWTVLGVVEHVVVAERSLLARFGRAERSEAMLADAERETRMAAMLRERSGRVQAPERSWPAGRFGTLAEALDAFLAARGETIAYARDHHADLYWLKIPHPMFGTVNGVEMLRNIAAHSSRHADQIREILSGGTVP